MHSKNPESGNDSPTAYLLRDSDSPLHKSVIPPLVDCWLTAIDGGIRLSGFNRHERLTKSKQGWWVVPR